MQHLTEDKVKSWLRQSGIPVPDGGAATSPEQAAEVARQLSGSVAIKALIPTGRRGKSGAIRFADTAAQAAATAQQILGSTVNGYVCKAVYVEQKIDFTAEFYLSFFIDEFPPKVLVSTQGGVEIEDAHKTHPEAVVTRDIDPLRGIPVWDALALWEQTGLESKLLPVLSRLTADLYACFKSAEATMLELNPIVVDAAGKATVVGAMMATEDTMFEQADLEAEACSASGLGGINERERRVIEANRQLPGGMMRYTELDGNIGMFVGGGGASLLQHDLVLAEGGRPADHMDASTVNMDKVRVLIDAILDNPRVQGLLVGWHYQQMARADKRVIPIIQALKDRKVDPEQFPIVIRMFGPGEDEARRAAAELKGVHYVPHGAPLRDAVRLIVKLTERVARAEHAR